MERKLNVAILPAGSFGRALTVPLSENNHQITLCFRSEESLLKFSNTQLPANVRSTTDYEGALRGANVIFFAPPSRFLRSYYSSAYHLIPKGADVVFGTKGIEEGTNLTTFQVPQDVNPTLKHWAIMSGPNFAHEIAGRQYTETVIASIEDGVAERLRDVFKTDRFKPFITDDVMGVALGGSLKNLVAMTVGIYEGRGMGSNASAGLINSGLREAIRLAVVMGADERTLYGRSGLADIILSCRPPGRNYLAGFAIGEGANPESLIEAGKTIEGFYSVKSAVTLGEKFGVEVPMFRTLYEVLYQGLSVDRAIEKLMNMNGAFEDPSPVISRKLRFPLRSLNRLLHLWHRVK